MFGLRGTNHICSSPRQPALITGMSLWIAPEGVGVGTVVNNCSDVAVSASAVAVMNVVWFCSAVCVAERAVTV